MRTPTEHVDDAWFAGDPDLSGEYLPGYRDITDAGEQMPRDPHDPPIYAALLVDLAGGNDRP